MPWYESQGSDKMGNFPDPQSKSPFSTMAPATAFPCPQRNLVALCSTISAPQSNGRIRYGVACQHVVCVCGGQDNAHLLSQGPCKRTEVLSTITGRPWRCATSTKASRSTITPPGFAMTSQKTAFVFSSISSSIADMSSASANLASQPNCL